jgi:hypothetical protein
VTLAASYPTVQERDRALLQHTFQRIRRHVCREGITHDTTTTSTREIYYFIKDLLRTAGRRPGWFLTDRQRAAVLRCSGLDALPEVAAVALELPKAPPGRKVGS